MSPISNVKTVLISLYEEGEDRPSSALRYGLSLAAAAGAHANLQAGSIKLDVPSSRGSAVLADYVIAENSRVRRVAERIAHDARGDGAMAGVVCETTTPQGDFNRLKERSLVQARVSDVVVMDAAPEIMTVRGDLLRKLIFEGGRPVIVTPPDAGDFSCERVLVAWDGSQSASRAVAGATPFLQAAGSVEIVCVQDEPQATAGVAGADLAAALARRGVNVTLKELNKGASAAETLRDQCGFFHADLMVLGARVHSTLRDWLFGGVTQSMLKSPPTPLLMAH